MSRHFVALSVLMLLACGATALLRNSHQAGPRNAATDGELAADVTELLHESDDFFLVKPAVQFGCAITPTAYEDLLEEELNSGTLEQKTHALRVLMRVHAPSSVRLQWQALQELKTANVGSMDELNAAFDRDGILSTISGKLPGDRYSENRTLAWNIRAAGVLQIWDALPRLTTIANSNHLDASLAATTSIGEFVGPDADRALAEVVCGWQYDAFVRAGNVLLERNPRLLNETLSATNAPEEFRYWQGIFLARCENPLAVPILCQEVHKVQIIDREIFEHIAHLGMPEHRNEILGLRKTVRADQRELAEQCIANYLRRMHVATPRRPQSSTPSVLLRTDRA